MKPILERCISIFHRVKYKIRRSNKDSSEKDAILSSLKQAEKEWKAKEEYFNHATDPDLVDFAIYDIEASRRKYTYLLKKLKKENNV